MDNDFFNNSNFVPVPKRGNKPLVLSLSIIALIIGGGMILYFTGLNSKLSEYFGSYVSEIPGDVPSEEADSLSEIEEIIDKVSRLIILPENEIPTMATVSDPEKLKDQPFFSQAKLGHKVLIYANAQKAILYDPVADIIINVAPINLGQSPAPK